MNGLTKSIPISFLLISRLLNSQPTDLKFVPLTIDEGLSQNSINCIHQDRFGFIWFGTQDGLNRYDGYEFKIYRHEPGVENSLGNNFVWAIHEDSGGIFWIGTFGGGLTRFDPATESFTNFKRVATDPTTISNDHVFSIIEYPVGTLWLGTDDGITKFNVKSRIATRYLQTPGNIDGLPSNHFSSLTIQSPDILWARTNSGLVRFDIKTQNSKLFTSDPVNGTIELGTVFRCLVSGDSLLISSRAGLVAVDFKQNKAFMIASQKVLGGGFARVLLKDHRGYFWIGTNKGVALYNVQSNTASLFTHEPDNPSSLVSNVVSSLLQSKAGVVWIGTLGGGVSKVEKLKQDFAMMRHDPGNPASLTHKSVGPVIEDSRGILWVGTSKGLNTYIKENESYAPFRGNESLMRRFSSSYILSLYEDRKGQVWVGTRTGGVHVLTFSHDAQPASVRTYVRGEASGLHSNAIQSIFEDSRDVIWLGTSGGGLSAFSSSTGRFTTYEHKTDGTGPSHPYIFSICEDTFGNLWLGTATGGLNIFDSRSKRFLYLNHNEENRRSLSNDLILSMFEDSKKRLWIGTAGGLNMLAIPNRNNLFDHLRTKNVSKESLFVSYGRSKGLPNDVIYGILEDDRGVLWLSTNKGLVMFDPDNDTPVLKTFDVTDGLQNNEFNQNSFFKNSNGEMFFGGIDGLNIFHPDSVRGNPYIPPVVLTDFLLFNESVPVAFQKDPERFSLAEAIHHTHRLELQHDHDVLSFSFAALNFVNSEKNQYAYMMKGFDRGWIAAGTKRSVTYTNLDPGEYAFLVKASNNDGVWNEAGTSILLSVHPPIWMRWYAYLIYAVMFAFSIVLVVRNRVRVATREIETKARIEHAKLEERDAVRRQSSADFHDEAGHKLTKISLFTELARGEASENPSLNAYLGKIEEQTKEISTGMRDFIWVLDPTKETLLDTMRRLEDFGNSMFGYTDTNFSVNGMTQEMQAVALSMECRRALMLIFKEGMNNSLKYAGAQNVSLSVRYWAETLELSLCDDGNGFDMNRSSNGYGMRTMRERAEKAGATFSITSSHGSGTTIRFAGKPGPASP